MSDEKICPIMSRPHIPTLEALNGNCCQKSMEMNDGLYWDGLIRCQKQDCMAWVPECPRYKSNDDLDPDCDGDDCLNNDREYLECKGGCRLI